MEGPTAPKIRMFMWKMMVKALPLGSTLATRGLGDSVSCKRCGGLEDAPHLLLSCPFAAKVWDLAPVLFKPRPADLSLDSLLICAKKMLNLPTLGISDTPLFPWIWWHLWKARNLLCFEDKAWTEQEIINKALSDAKSWHCAQILAPQLKRPQPGHPQHPPLHSEFVCYVDAAWLAVSGNCGMGWFFQDSHEVSLLQGTKTRSFVPSALAAEALVVKHALISALDNELLSLQVFSDSQTLVHLLNVKESTVELRGILSDISLLQLRFISLSFTFVPHTVVAIADSLAKSALSSLNSSSFGV